MKRRRDARSNVILVSRSNRGSLHVACPAAAFPAGSRQAAQDRGSRAARRSAYCGRFKDHAHEHESPLIELSRFQCWQRLRPGGSAHVPARGDGGRHGSDARPAGLRRAGRPGGGVSRGKAVLHPCFRRPQRQGSTGGDADPAARGAFRRFEASLALARACSCLAFDDADVSRVWSRSRARRSEWAPSWTSSNFWRRVAQTIRSVWCVSPVSSALWCG